MPLALVAREESNTLFTVIGRALQLLLCVTVKDIPRKVTIVRGWVAPGREEKHNRCANLHAW